MDRVERWKARCICGWEWEITDEGHADLEAVRHRAQSFFAELATEMRKPHFGDHQKSYVTALLLRAEEARLYTPGKEQS